jgi:FMN-dependent oxidoreductase (nitrilotriacetate monooxygenase family)
MAPRQLHFTAFIWPAGYHESAWRVVPDDPRSALGLPYYAEIARMAERGKLDALFLADNIAIAEYRVEYMPQTLFDPIEVLSALAALTDRIGLIATGSTTYSAPWDLARRFATLDFLSAGRAGWNIVTTSSVLTAANFGRSEHPSHAQRYARAREFVDVVQRVWDGWEDDAIVGSKQTGVWADRSKLHAPRFRGEHYEVAGILPFPRSPQGHPVLVQAGSSVAGVDLAAHYAELVFTRQPTVADAAGFRSELRAQVAAAGRSADHVHVLPALTYTLASTEAEARARQDELETLASPEFRWRNMLWNVGLDPDGFDPDAPLPDELLAGPAPTSGAERLFAAARGERVPLRELARIHAGMPAGLTFIGTPEQLADFIDEWSRAGAADGFTLMPTTLPDGLATFVEHVLPILRRRELFRTEYTGTTLREHFGLPRPRNRHEAVAPV